MTISMLFLVIAGILFFFSAFGWWKAGAQPYSPNLIGAGLFFWVLSIVVNAVH